MTSDPRLPAPEPSPAASKPEPMGIGRVLEVGLQIVRRQWAVLLAVSLVLVGPVALLSAALSNRFLDVVGDVFPGFSEGVIDDTAVTTAEVERLMGALGEYGLGVILAGVFTSIATLGFSAVVGIDYHHQPSHLSGVLRRALGRTPTLIAYMLLSTAAIVGIIAFGGLVAGAALAVLSGGSGGGPGAFVALIAGVSVAAAVIYLSLRWAPALPMIANEPVGWRETFQRSWHLTGNNVLRIIAIIVLASIIASLISWVLGLLLTLLLVDVLAASIGLDTNVANVVAIAAASVLVAPLSSVWMAVLYFDLRARRDAPGTVTDLTI